MEISQPDPVSRHAVQVRSLKAFRAEAPDIGVPLVIGEDDDDVRRSRLPPCLHPRTAARQQTARGQPGLFHEIPSCVVVCAHDCLSRSRNAH